MKKLLLFLCALFISISGAWATTSTIYLGSSSTIKTNGTFYKDGSVVGAGYWCQSAVVAPITLTGCISSSSGYIDAGLSYGSETLTLSVPSGLTISSYTIGLKLTGSTTACTAGGVVLNNATSQTVSGSDINAQSASVAFSSITEDGNNECLIEITDLSIVVDGIAETFTREINAANGTFYSGSTVKTPGAEVQSVNRWVSSQNDPQIKLVTSDVVTRGESYQWGNNIPIDNVNGMRLHSDTYTLSVPDRYRIKGYVITGYTGAGKVYTITPNGQTAKRISTDSGKPTTIYVDGLNTTSTTFTVGGTSTGNPWIYITSFRVAVEDLVTKANAVLDELANISVYSSAATSAKTIIESATSQADIETAVNDAMNIKVAFKNMNAPTMYLATTGADVKGATFSTDAAWKLTGYNAEAGTFHLYNEAHETYLGSLPTALQVAATATTDVSSAGQWIVSATTEKFNAEDENAINVLVFRGTRTDYSDNYDALHYQTDGSKAVRWSKTAKASKWAVENVYELTYNHYKVADAENPSTEGATLLASSTNYYISGTEIEYADPFDGLSPVTALNDKPSDGAISSDVVVDYYYEQDATLPFTTSTITNGELDNPTWYYMQVNGLAAYASGDRMVVDGSSTGLHYERWCFVGDAIYGVQIFAESKGVAYPLNIASMSNNDNVRISSTSTNTRWFVTGSDLSNLVFYQKSGNTTFALNQLGGTSGGGSWYWRVGLWSSGSTVKLSAASSNMPNAWAMEAINYIPTQAVYTNANTIGWPSSTARGTLEAAIAAFGQGTSYNNYSALLNAWNTYQNTSDIKKPSAGFYKVYHPLSSDGTKKYVTVSGSTPTATVTVSDEASAIWYYTGERLVAYSNGYQVKGNASGGEAMVVGGIAVDFQKSNVSGYGYGYMNVVPSSRSPWYVSPDKEDFVLNRWSGGSHDGQQFKVEEVTSLPVTISDAGYATLKSPVALTIPDGVKAYVGKVKGEGETKYFTLTALDEVIPANTPVILKGAARTYDFVITTSNEYDGDNDLSGTIAAENVSGILTLQKINEVVGLYSYTGTSLDGFKAYLINSKVSGVKKLIFSFDDETSIQEVDGEGLKVKDEIIFNLAGQRVAKAQKGLYIVNGKKILVK